MVALAGTYLELSTEPGLTASNNPIKVAAGKRFALPRPVGG